MKNIKVAFPIIKAGTGSDIYFSRLQKGLRKAGVDSDIIALPYRFEFVPGLARQVRARLEKYDIIHTNADYGGLFYVPGKPLIVTAHHNVFEPSYQDYTSVFQKIYHYGLLRRRLKESFRLATSVICPSEYSRRSFANSFPEFSEKFSLVYNGIDLDTYYPRAGIKKIEKSLVMVGTYSLRKGSDLVLPLMDRLPGYSLTWVTSYKKKLPFHPSIRYLNNLGSSELAELFTKSESCISLSRLEGFGYSVVESMACGTPVVCTSVSSFPEIVIDGENGFLVPPNDLEKIAERVKEITSIVNGCSLIKDRCVSRVRDLFGLDDMIKEILHFYGVLL